jgi:hypothetical protein
MGAVEGFAEPVAGLADAEVAWPAARQKSLHATERDTQENLRRREEFLTRVASIDPKRLVFQDESGVTTSMTRLYGRNYSQKT